jgi:hypothetical protein
MPEHKMITINGVRVRAEDETRYRRRRTVVSEGGQAAPLTRAQAKPKQDQEPQGADGGGFDPSEHTVLQVIAHLAEADMEETARVLDVEAAADARKGLLERRAEFLAEARQREMGGSGGGA